MSNQPTPFQVHSVHSINGISLPSKESADRVLNVTNAIFSLFETHNLSDFEMNVVLQLVYPQIKGK